MGSVIIALLALCAAPNQSFAERLVVAEGAHIIGYAPAYIAQDQGYFKDAGLDVDIVLSHGSAQAVAAVVGGSADLTLATASDVLNAVAHGRQLRMILGITNQPQLLLTVSPKLLEKEHVTPASPVADRARALKGARIAISTPGSMTDEVLRTILKIGGLDPDRDVSIIAMGGDGAPMLAALQHGNIDGFVFSPPAGNEAQAKNYGTILVNLMAGDVDKYRGMLFQIGAVAPAILEKRKPALTAFLRAIARAQDLIAKHPDQGEALARKSFPNIDPEVFKAAFTAALPSFLPNPSIPASGLEKAIAFSPLAGKTSAADLVDEAPAHDAMTPAGGTGPK
ncbi:MAG TPA: ABC transporter substrate-binding protein [Stellaceae bacterium]|jgi:NitT/TauT family transport system substrate-binding protein|nr:ABC transporter substrate-binding protein [Stellaceae bacterium]